MKPYKIDVQVQLSDEDRKLMEKLNATLEAALQRSQVDVTIRQVEVGTEDPDKFVFDLAKIANPRFE
jgi:hypothetical protein